MIGLVRSCLRYTMHDISYRTPDDEALLTMMKEIEGILNSRPLLPAGLDPNSFDVLTPAQILQPGTPSVPQAVREFTSADSIRRGYRSAQWHIDQFWRRFSSKYIPPVLKSLQGLQNWFCIYFSSCTRKAPFNQTLVPPHRTKLRRCSM